MENQIFLGLGSNIGDKKAHIEKAIILLQEKITEITVASIYETKPMYYTQQDNFLNTVLAGKTDLEPEDLLKFTQSVQEQAGRIKRFRNGPREIDIDIIFYENVIISTDTLDLPHPRLQERSFVLVPLAEIAPDFIHPVLKKSARKLLDDLLVEQKS